MAFKPAVKLNVHRRLSTGELIDVGQLAQNRQGVFFQYSQNYLTTFGNLSPFQLTASTELQPAPLTPHQGLHGVFADSLPDGWGLLLQDRIFRQHDILPMQITAMDRLAFVGEHGMGALSYTPISEYAQGKQECDLATLGTEAQRIFDGQTAEVLAALVAASSSGGARPKAQIYLDPTNPDICQTHLPQTESKQKKREAWLVKFTSKNLSLGHEESLCEASYLELAKIADLQPPQWQLFTPSKESGAKAWLGVKRFDVNAQNIFGRYHMHSACGLLDADFRMPSLDYEDLIKLTMQLCQNEDAAKLMFTRAMFNLFTLNQDDHSKNWSFLQNDEGNWQLSPFYDVTFSPHPFNEHATAFCGYGNNPPLKSIQKLAALAGFDDWQQAKHAINHIVDSIQHFSSVAKGNQLSQKTTQLIANRLNDCRKDNRALL